MSLLILPERYKERLILSDLALHLPHAPLTARTKPRIVYCSHRKVYLAYQDFINTPWSSPWAVPTTFVSSLLVELGSGGGSGGGCTGAGIKFGGGGGGGNYLRAYLDTYPGQPFNLGAPTQAGTSTGDGNGGGFAVFQDSPYAAIWLHAYGGNPGKGFANGSVGGTPGVASLTQGALAGFLATYGGVGQTGTTGGGYGGGSANEGGALGIFGGPQGQCSWLSSNGADGRKTLGAGIAGPGVSAAGGGAYKTSAGVAQQGGIGARGQVRVWWQAARAGSIGADV